MSRAATRWAVLVGSLTVCSSLSAQSAIQFTLPFGPHVVGFKSVDQYDYSRAFGTRYDENGTPFSSPHARPIQTSIWYPSSESAAATRMRYTEYLELSSLPGALPSHDRAEARKTAERSAYAFAPQDSARIKRELAGVMQAVRNGSPKPGRFPVIIYGASFDAPSIENATLMEYLASHGFIVIASPSVGANGGQTVDAEGAETEARDMEFLIAYARSIPGADTNRLAVMGFSWGGLASVLVASRNPSVTALVSLDGSIAYFYHKFIAAMPFISAKEYITPSLFLRQRPLLSSQKAGLGPDTAFDFFEDLRHADAYSVTLTTIAHNNFGERFNRLLQSGSVGYVTDIGVQSAAYNRIAAYAKNFLDAYLKDSGDGKAYLAHDPEQNGYPSTEIIIKRKIGLRPALSLAAFASVLAARHQQPADAPALLAEVRRTDPEYVLAESEVNDWGYRLLGVNKFADAIGALRINVTMYPKSWSVYDSLGEAYMKNGDRALAIENYQRSLDLDPHNSTAVAMLKKLRSGS
jgi:pimeloyl-ACP methyl ester carboxylesterase